MHVQRQNEAVLFLFNHQEARILSQVLGMLNTTYQLPYDEIDPAIAEVWYSTKGCDSAGMSEGESREWLNNLHSIKTSRLDKLGDWLKLFMVSKSKPIEIKLSIEDASCFLTVINDYRLMMAAQCGIGEQEMAMHSAPALACLPEIKRRSLFEIHFLAWVIEETLGALQASE